MSFASKLQEIRQKNGVSQEQLAELLNVSRQSVSKWERGKGYPEIDKIIFISEHFGVTIDELLKESITDAPFQRRPISLEKDTSRTVREKYPGEQQNPFPAQEVQQPADLMQYGNYSFAQNQTVSGRNTSSVFDRHRRRIFKNRRTRLLVLLILFWVMVINFFIFRAMMDYSDEQNVPERYIVSTAMNETFEPYSDYNVSWYIDPEKGDYYLFDADSEYGIVSQIWNEDMETYISLTNPETDEKIFCYDWYYDDCLKIEINGDIFVMPEYFTDSLIGSSEYDNYCIGKDQNGVVRFIPKYLLPSSWIDGSLTRDSEQAEDPEKETENSDVSAEKDK